MHLARHNKRKRKFLRHTDSERLGLFRVEELSEADNLQALFALWPSSAALAKLCLTQTKSAREKLDVCMRYIETGGTEEEVWSTLVTVLTTSKAGEHYQFEAWHFHFFDSSSAKGTLKQLKDSAAAATSHLLPPAFNSFRLLK